MDRKGRLFLLCREIVLIFLLRMVTSIAGRRPRKSEMAVDQDAPVGGVLGELGLKSSQVRRL